MLFYSYFLDTSKGNQTDMVHFCELLYKVLTDCVGFNNTSTLVGHFCRLPEKGRKEIEEIVEEMKERDRPGKIEEQE